MANLKVIKTANKDYIFVGCDNVLKYTIQINNIGSNAATNVILKDEIPSGLEFIPNTVFINGTKQNYINIDNGINIGSINPNDGVIVTFKVKINNDISFNEISNIGIVSFSSLSNPEETSTAITNELIIPVIKIDLQIFKSVNTNNALINDVLTFDITIVNSSNIPLNNVFFKDPLEPELRFVNGSVRIDGILYNFFDPNIGFNLENINAKSTTIINFQASIDKIPSNTKISNVAKINFDYSLPSEPSLSSNGCASSNMVSIQVGPNSFKQFSIDEILKIPSQKPDAEEVIDVNIEVEIIDLNLIKTICGVSCEGQRLTGNKLIVNGLLKQIVEYVALNPEQSVHAAEFDMPFSTFIIVPKEFTLDNEVNIISHIEDVYFELLDKRTVFKNTTLFLEVGY